MSKPLHLKLVLAATDKISAPMRKITAAFALSMKAMSAATQKLSERVNKLDNSLKQAGMNMSLAFSAPIMGIGLVSLKSAADIETLTRSLSTLAGGTTQARLLLKDLNHFAAISGQSLESVADAAKTLMHAGYKNHNLTEQLRRLGEIAAGSKAGFTQLSELMAQVRRKGTAGASEIDVFENNHIPMINALAEVTGKSRRAIITMAADGKIALKDLERALGRLTSEGGKFYGKMNEQGQSITGAFQNFRLTLSDIMADFGSMLGQEFDIGGKLQSVTNALRGLFDAFTGLPKPVKSAILNFGLILAVSGPLLVVIGQFTIGLAAMILVFGKLPALLIGAVAAFKAFSAVLLTTPIGWFTLGVTALVTSAYLLINNWSKVKVFFVDLWGSITQVFDLAVGSIMPILSPLLEAITLIKNGFGFVTSAMDDNPVTRFVRRHISPVSLSDQPGAIIPAIPSGMAPQKIDTGGTLHIQIDADGQPRVVSATPNDQRINYSVDTGLLMGGF